MSKIIIVKELCEVDCINWDDAEGTYKALRTVRYETDYNLLVHALIDYEDNFNCDKVVSCNDDFEGTCLCSETVSIEWENIDDINFDVENTKERYSQE